MSVSLPRLRVTWTAGDPALTIEPPNAVPDDDAELLRRLDAEPRTGPPTWRQVPLAGGRTAIGRADPWGSTWRITDERLARRLGSPAWLWTEAAWFEAASDRGGPPTTSRSLRGLVRHASALVGSVRGVCETLVAVVAAVRRRRRPVNIVIDERALGRNDARALVLAALATMPPSLRNALRVSTYEERPSPVHWDLVVSAQPARGFTVVRADMPPAVDDDVVASYLLDRLLARDPESVEAAAHLPLGDGDDPWADAVRAHLRGGVPGASGLDAELLERDPEAAIAMVLRRLQSGVPVRGPVAAEIAAVTLATGDLRPWKMLRQREEDDRYRAVRAFLAHVEPRLVPASLWLTIADLAPMGPALAPFCGAMVRGLAEVADPTPIIHRLDELFSDPAVPIDLTTRASLWQEVLQSLVRRERWEAAVDAILAPAARRLASEGVGGVLVHGWLSIPSRHRGASALRTLVGVLGDAPEPDHTLATLYMGHLAQHGDPACRIVVQHWAQLRAASELDGPDELLVSLSREHATEWAEAIVRLVPPERARALVAAAARGADDPIWAEAEAELARERKAAPSARLLDLERWLPDGAAALDRVAVGLLDASLAQVTFPSLDLARVAEQLAAPPDNSPLWMWVTITAAPPGALADDTIDGTVMEFCASPPREATERALARRCAEHLARAADWQPLEHARWLVRLALAPDGDGTGFNLDLAALITRTIARERDDAVPRMAAIAQAVLELEAEHPATLAFVAHLLPDAFGRAPPRAFTDAIDWSEVPMRTRELFRAALRRR